MAEADPPGYASPILDLGHPVRLAVQVAWLDTILSPARFRAVALDPYGKVCTKVPPMRVVVRVDKVWARIYAGHHGWLQQSTQLPSYFSSTWNHSPSTTLSIAQPTSSSSP